MKCFNYKIHEKKFFKKKTKQSVFLAVIIAEKKVLQVQYTNVIANINRTLFKAHLMNLDLTDFKFYRSKSNTSGNYSNIN